MWKLYYSINFNLLFSKIMQVLVLCLVFHSCEVVTLKPIHVLNLKSFQNFSTLNNISQFKQHCYSQFCQKVTLNSICHSIYNNPDITCLSETETWLDSSILSDDDNLEISGYDLIIATTHPIANAVPVCTIKIYLFWKHLIFAIGINVLLLN